MTVHKTYTYDVIKTGRQKMEFFHNEFLTTNEICFHAKSQWVRENKKLRFIFWTAVKLQEIAVISDLDS